MRQMCHMRTSRCYRKVGKAQRVRPLLSQAVHKPMHVRDKATVPDTGRGTARLQDPSHAASSSVEGLLGGVRGGVPVRPASMRVPWWSVFARLASVDKPTPKAMASPPMSQSPDPPSPASVLASSGRFALAGNPTTSTTTVSSNRYLVHSTHVQHAHTT
jgi:hypothetical protein